MVTGTVGELIGLSAYIEIGALNRFMGDSDVVLGISVALDKSREKDFFAYLKGHPKIATSGSKTAMLLGVLEPAAPALLDARTERELSARVGAAKAIQARADAGVAKAPSPLKKSRADRRRSRALAAALLFPLPNWNRLNSRRSSLPATWRWPGIPPASQDSILPPPAPQCCGCIAMAARLQIGNGYCAPLLPDEC